MFVFAPGRGGDRVKDFKNGLDRLDQTAFELETFEGDVNAIARATAVGLRMSFDNGAVLFVEGFERAGFEGTDVLL